MRAIRERVMGTELLLVLPPREAADVLAWLREVERVFSRFLPDSDTSRANAGAGAADVSVSALFLRVLDEAYRHQVRTGGLFSPFLGAELVRIGYAVDFARLGRADRPAPTSAGPAPAGPPPANPSAADPPPADQDPPRVHLDHDVGTVRLPPGIAVDLGGFVKGWSVQAAADALTTPRCLIDAGGDLVARSGPADPPWRVGVAHPLTPEPVGTLALSGSVAVATSSVVRRSWRDAAGTHRHHVIDPRTGEPADSDCLQATVLTRDLAAAEVYATCLTILGTADGPDWLADRDPDAGWLTVDRSGAVRTSPDVPLEHPG